MAASSSKPNETTTPQRPAAPKNVEPQAEDRVRLYDGTNGVDEEAVVTNVQGPHGDGGHVIDVQTSPDGPEREAIFSVRFLADEAEARKAGAGELVAFPVKGDE